MKFRNEPVYDFVALVIYDNLNERVAKAVLQRQALAVVEGDVHRAGGLKKLFVIHFRNVSAPLPHFHEAYLNEGYMDMYKIIRALRKVDFDGVLIADHWPTSVAGPLVSHV